MPNERNIKLYNLISELMKDKSGIIFASFKGMSVAELEELRKKVYKEEAIAKVVKNTLIKKFLEKNNMKISDEILKENTIIFTSKDDIIKILKILVDYSKNNEKFLLKGVYYEGEVFDNTQVVELSKLPSKKELIAMILGSINSIIGNFAGTLNSVLTTFVGTLEAIENKKKDN